MTAGRRLLPLLALLALILAACGDPSTESPENGGDVPAGAAGDIELEASNFAFQPTELTVDPGASTTLGFTNGDDVEHSFTSDDLGIDEAVEGGASTTITIDAPDKDGTHEFHCRFHPQMTGKIVVGSGGAGGGGGKTSTTTDDNGGGGGTSTTTDDNGGVYDY